VTQDDVVLRGHAIECRINAEDAAKNFAPSPGTLSRYREPAGPGVRVDSGVLAGSEITPLYDPMVAKLIVWDADRQSATRRMARALGEYEIDGVRTLIPFHRAIMASEQWARAETCRDLIEDRAWLKTLAFDPAPRSRDDDGAAEPLERSYTVEVSGKRFDVRVLGEAPAAGTNSTRPPPRRAERKAVAGGGAGGDTLASPLQGNVFRVLVEQGAEVEEGALVCIIEAMKMENEIAAHKAGVVAELPISEGAAVSAGDTLAVIRSPE
jgi:acetyl-CoA/propionyl-CoA carboxylase, biotin carboxylase, biotin carboxyl carrier protein